MTLRCWGVGAFVDLPLVLALVLLTAHPSWAQDWDSQHSLLNGIRPEILAVIGDPGTGLIPSCEESTFASIALFLPRTVYNTGEALVTSRMVHRLIQTPYGLCRLAVSPVVGGADEALDRIAGESILNPGGTLNDTVTTVTKMMGAAVGSPRPVKAQRIELVSRNLGYSVQVANEFKDSWSKPLAWAGLIATQWLTPAVHYELQVDGLPLESGGIAPSHMKENQKTTYGSFHLERRILNVAHREKLAITSGESETIVIQRLLEAINHDFIEYGFWDYNCGGLVADLAADSGLRLDRVPNLGIGCQLGRSLKPSRETAQVFIDLMRAAIVDLERGKTPSPESTDRLAKMLHERVVWGEYFLTLMDAAIHAGKHAWFESLIPKARYLFFTERALREAEDKALQVSDRDRQTILRLRSHFLFDVVRPEIQLLNYIDFAANRGVGQHRLAELLTGPYSEMQTSPQSDALKPETSLLRTPPLEMQLEDSSRLPLLPATDVVVELENRESIYQQPVVSASLRFKIGADVVCTVEIPDILTAARLNRPSGDIQNAVCFKEGWKDGRVVRKNISVRFGLLVGKQNSILMLEWSNLEKSMDEYLVGHVDHPSLKLSRTKRFAMLHWQYPKHPLWETQPWEENLFRHDCYVDFHFLEDAIDVRTGVRLDRSVETQPSVQSDPPQATAGEGR